MRNITRERGFYKRRDKRICEPTTILYDFERLINEVLFAANLLISPKDIYAGISAASETGPINRTIDPLRT